MNETSETGTAIHQAALEVPSWAIVESNEEYHARDAIGSTKLKTARRSLLGYYKRYVENEPLPEPTLQMKIGTIVHTIALEGIDALGEKYMILGPDDGPINSRTGNLYGRETKAFDKWIDENANGRTIVTRDDIELAHMLSEHPLVKDMLISSGHAELSVVVDMYGMQCQCRPDRLFMIGNDYIFELKTCSDINWFPYWYREQGYHYQNAWYRQIIYEASLKNMEVFVGAVEKTPEKRVGAWHVDPVMLDEHAKENDETLLEIKNCMDTNHWPVGHLEDMGELNIDTIGKPRWN